MLSKGAREQLLALVIHYPLWPGDTLSHATMREVFDAGFAVRDASANWIPTAAGILEAERINTAEAKGAT